MKSRMPERARTDPWEPQGSNPLGPPGPELYGVPGTIKSGSFVCWIPHYFVISPNLTTTNTRAIWLRSCAFLTPLLSPPIRSLQFHWPTATGYRPLFSRHSPLPPRSPPSQRAQVMHSVDPPPLTHKWIGVSLGFLFFVESLASMSSTAEMSRRLRIQFEGAIYHVMASASPSPTGR